jgi:hypothetical protein
MQELQCDFLGSSDEMIRILRVGIESSAAVS